ncbi:MAG: type I-B CRISPR-associated protein Cas7/Cst2/DevR [Desulfofundulus sp.]
MSFVTGLMLIDAPASALNNQGMVEGALAENAVAVKYIRTREGAYPYVSAQAFRYWLRRTLETGPWEWKAAPIYREQKVAYTDANPIRWWDDDLFGYMRAPSKKQSAVEARNADQTRDSETPTAETVTRASPFRMSTLVAIAPVSLTNDFGVMARHEGNPVPHEHQFYRTTLQGLFSLDLHAAGTFSYKSKTGFLNLDEVRIQEAKERGLKELPDEKAYRLPFEERFKRVKTLLTAITYLDGGAKQALHYTDVTPDLLFCAVTRGGNHIFGHIIKPDSAGRPTINLEAFDEVLTVHKDDILSTIYVGWVKGYLDDERTKFEQHIGSNQAVQILHPREAMQALCDQLSDHPDWMD